MGNRYFLTVLTAAPGKEIVKPTQCEMILSPRGTLEENIAWARTEALEREGCDDAAVTCAIPVSAPENVEDCESRYAFMLLVTKEEDSTSASIILCERKFPHKIPTWDDLMDFQKKIAEENGWVSARIISANRQTDYDYDEDENDIVGDYEGGGADGAE